MKGLQPYLCRFCIRNVLGQREFHTSSIQSGRTWVKKLHIREDIRERVVQYVGENARRADRVYVWGFAATGALGIRSYLEPGARRQHLKYKHHKPARLRFIDQQKLKVHDVACGYGFTLMAGKSENKEHCVYGTGINTDSQLGYHEYPRNSGRILDSIIEPVPIHLPFLHQKTSRVRCVSAGRAHGIILTNEGVFSLGNNAYGQCGRPIVDVFSLGNNAYGQCGRPIVDGEIYRGNQLVNKIKDMPENVTQVVCGQDHTLFLTDKGELYSCGLGSDGQTGLGHHDVSWKPTKVTGDIEGVKIVQVSGCTDCVLAVSDAGDLFGWGNSEYNQLAVVTDHTQVNNPRHLKVNCGRVVQAAAGGATCALINDAGQVYVWGYGILGKGPNVDSAVAPTLLPETLFGVNELNPQNKVVSIQSGLNHFMALSNSGDLYAWGRNKTGCLGLGRYADQFFPLRVAMPAEVQHVYCGVDHTVALCKSYV